MFVLVFCFRSCICSLGGLNKVIFNACIVCICLNLDAIFMGSLLQVVVQKKISNGNMNLTIGTFKYKLFFV
jgi:hypothetical protein